MSQYPSVTPYPPAPGYGQVPQSSKSFLVTWLFSLLLGVLGVDRFYLGKVGTGILKLVTFGGLGVWALVDLILVLANKTRDKQGLPLEGYEKHRKVALIVTAAFILLSIVFNATRGEAVPTSSSAVPAVDGTSTSVQEGTQAEASDAAQAAEASEAAEAEAQAAAEASAEAEAEASAEAEREAAEASASAAAEREAAEASASAEAERAAAEASASAEAEREAAAKAEAEAAAAGTVAQRNALRSAENYLEFTAFSRSGLIDQLEYEGYSTADATWAVGRVSVDWNEQAAKSAENYLEFTAFSRSGLIDQLLYEGFTRAQAEYGVAQTGL